MKVARTSAPVSLFDQRARLRAVAKGCWNRKKGLRALAEWSFGGGDGYCAACQSPCPDCPARLNRPKTFEGWQVWDLAQRLGGQLRVPPGAVVGRDMGAALGFAHALAIPPLAVVELLPPIEAVMVRRFNEQIASGRGERFDV